MESAAYVQRVAAWVRAEEHSATARIESAHAERVAAWARAEVLSATARVESAAAVSRAGATASVLAILLVLTAGLGMPVAASEFPSFDSLVGQHSISLFLRLDSSRNPGWNR